MAETLLAANSSWQYATKCVALLEMVLSVFQIAYSIFAFTHSFQSSGDVDFSSDSDNTDNTTNVAFNSSINVSEHDYLETTSTLESIWLLAYGVFCLILAVVLYWGAVRRNLTKCKIWMIASLILFAVEIVDVVRVLLTYPSLTLAIDFVILFINGLCMWIVYVFMEEIRGVSRSFFNPKPRV